MTVLELKRQTAVSQKKEMLAPLLEEFIRSGEYRRHKLERGLWIIYDPHNKPNEIKIARKNEKPSPQEVVTVETRVEQIINLPLAFSDSPKATVYHSQVHQEKGRGGRSMWHYVIIYWT